MAMAPPEGPVDLWAMAADLERQFAGYKQRFPERTSTGGVDDDDDDAVVAAMAMAPPEGPVDLWAMAAELERQFAGYKQRFPERINTGVVDDDDAAADYAGGVLHVVDGDGASSSGDEEAEDAAGGDVDRVGGGGGVRGRMYEAYTRRRDERLRFVWRARMERKEAEVMALWARLDAVRAGRAGAGQAAAEEEDDDGGCTAGEQEAEEDGEKRRSSDVAAPGRVPGKKHPLTRRSSSSANLTKSSRPDVGIRRAVSQEPPPHEPSAAADDGGSRKHGHRTTRAGTGGAGPKRKALSGSKGSLRQTGTKPPRGGTPRQCSSGGPGAVLVANTGVATPARVSISSEQDAASDREGEARAPEASPPGPFVGIDNGTGAKNARPASPESDCGEVVDGSAPAAEGAEAAEAENAVIDADRRDGEETAVVQSAGIEGKLGNGEITSDSETEPSYVVIKKVAVEGNAMRLSDALGAGLDAEPHLEVNDGTGNGDQATGISTTANAEESSDGMSSFSGTGRSGRDSSAPNSGPSCSSRSQSIERQLEEDAALLRHKRQNQSTSGARRSAQAAPSAAPSTPPSARSKGSSRATSPRGTAMGFKKRFLSFGKKNRDRDGATAIVCTSPASPADGGGARRRCRTADPVRRRTVGSSSDAAAAVSDDTADHGYADSPQAYSLQSLVAAASPAKSELSEMAPREKSPKPHRSFFSFRSFNCGRG